MAGYQEADLQTWQAWKRQPSDATMQAVLDRLDPIIQTEVNRWTGTLARPALETEAKLLAVEAIQSFSTSGGASLATHVTNRLKKLSRISYTHQNIARIPEYQTLKFRTFTDAQAKLMDKHGREPTHDELADELNWSKPALKNYQGSLRREFVESGDLPPFFDKEEGDNGMIDFVYHDLAPEQQKVFEHTTGYGGAKVMDNAGMMKKLKLTQGQLSYQKRLITQNFGRALNKKIEDE
jgi:DNA-directed RNA polymerase specialized sigma subunit